MITPEAPTHSMPLSDSLRAALLVCFGALEGYAFATSGMTYPSTFRSQMVFSKQILLQLFLSAVGSSMVAQGIFSLLHLEKFENSRGWKYTSVGFLRAIVGCFILGCGMTIAGSGPTMLPSQIGVGTEGALWTLAGALLGGVAFSLMEHWEWFRTNFDRTKEEKLTVDEMFGGHYAQWTLGLGSIMLLADYALPKYVDVGNDRLSLSPLLATTPLIAGLSVGLNQIPMRLLAECGQGGSRAIMQMVATLTGGKLANRFQIQGLGCTNQLVYVWGGTLLGAVIASLTLALPRPDGYGAWDSLLGGALMVFGARIAAGCACGHGVSGFSELNLQSIAGACAIFAGGIATMLLSGLTV